jgi:5-(carboxyamino)imidazole ribonucleotide mutase
MSGKVLVVMGSDSDWKIMEKAVKTLKEFQVECEVHVASAHRTPTKALALSREAHIKGFDVIIAGAGAAAHLAGVLASETPLPIIGVPINGTALQGVDALYATVQMPSGVPVATVAIDGAKNAALLAIQMLGIKDAALRQKFLDYKQTMAAEVEGKDQKIQAMVKQVLQAGGQDE